MAAGLVFLGSIAQGAVGQSFLFGCHQPLETAVGSPCWSAYMCSLVAEEILLYIQELDDYAACLDRMQVEAKRQRETAVSAFSMTALIMRQHGGHMVKQPAPAKP